MGYDFPSFKTLFSQRKKIINFASFRWDKSAGEYIRVLKLWDQLWDNLYKMSTLSKFKILSTDKIIIKKKKWTQNGEKDRDYFSLLFLLSITIPNNINEKN